MKLRWYAGDEAGSDKQAEILERPFNLVLRAKKHQA